MKICAKLLLNQISANKTIEETSLIQKALDEALHEALLTKKTKLNALTMQWLKFSNRLYSKEKWREWPLLF